MTKITQLALTLLLIFGGVVAPTPQSDPPRRTMAVTIDDLPYVNPAQLKYLPSAQRATNDILRTLKTHHAPAVGFVIEKDLQAAGEVAARTALLKQWVDAGMTLGNHTYSHPDFNSLTVEQFEQEIVKGEPVTQKLMESRKPYQ